MQRSPKSPCAQQSDGSNWFWALMLRWGVVHARMPYWRVVVEAKPDHAARFWPAGVVSAVAPVYVWAHTIEEAEALAVLAIEAKGLKPATADAVTTMPRACPRSEPTVVACGVLRFVIDEDCQAASTSL